MFNMKQYMYSLSKITNMKKNKSFNDIISSNRKQLFKLFQLALNTYYGFGERDNS